MALKNQFRAQLNVEGRRIGNEFWDAFMGGKHTQSESKYTPYDGVQRVYTGVKQTENVTLEASYEEAIHGPLCGGPNDPNDLRGRAAEVIVFDKVPGTDQYERRRAPYKGLVFEVIPPDGDSNDASTIVKMQIVVSVGEPGQ